MGMMNNPGKSDKGPSDPPYFMSYYMPYDYGGWDWDPFFIGDENGLSFPEEDEGFAPFEDDVGDFGEGGEEEEDED